jgi:hypothetical protein
MENLNRTKLDNLKGSAKSILKYIGIVILIKIVWSFVSFSSHGNKGAYIPPYVPSLNEMLVSVADSLNNKGVVWNDSITEFTGVTLPQSKAIQYNYQLKIDASKYNIGKLKKIMDTSVFNNAIKGEDCRTFKDSGVTIIYNYCDISNKFLFQCIYTPYRYKGV